MTKKNNIEELKKVRKKIDNIDNKIIELIGDRFKEIHKVTKLKENREEIIDHERITHILKSVQAKAKKNKKDAMEAPIPNKYLCEAKKFLEKFPKKKTVSE